MSRSATVAVRAGEADSIGRVRARSRWRWYLLAAAVALTGTLAADDALASAGDLDPTFSEDGQVLTNLPGGRDEAADVARQADGKLVVAGRGGGNFVIARYNSDGSLDRTFAGDGIQVTDFGPPSDFAAAVSIQTDGNIVVAGQGDGRVAVARYRPNGSLDREFSGDGRLTTDFGRGEEAAADVGVTGGGKVVTVGSAATPDGEAVALARYQADGSLDPTFSGDGKQTIGKRGDDVVRFDLYGTDLALLPHGRVAVVGTETTSETCCEFTRFFVLAYRADGRLDTGFGREGRADLKFLRDGNSTGWGISRQRDGRLVVAGSAYPTDPNSGGSSPSGATRFAVARLLPDGGLDRTFSATDEPPPAFPAA